MADGTRMQQRRATEAVWTTSDYVLAAGELGVTTDTGIIKIGNGTSPWSELNIAFHSDYLPLLGTAANSELLEGISADSFVKVIDTSTAATADMVMRRLSDGRAKAAAGTASDDVVNKTQLDASNLLTVARTLTANGTFALADAYQTVLVNHSSLTAQVTMSIPQNAFIPYPIGAWIECVAIGAGGVKINPSGGVTLSGASNAMPGYGAVRLLKTGTDAWVGISLNAGKRLPKIRAVRTGTQVYSVGSPTCIPYNTIDSTEDFYNPDNEWFSIPGSGLSTARRIIVNKSGEYLIGGNIITTAGTGQGAFICAKMVNDNTLTGARYYCNIPATATGQFSVRVRLAAGETVGAAYQPPTTSISDQADDTFGNRNDFTITRLSD